jgi:S-formylglutathione hydrolase FrmB
MSGEAITTRLVAQNHKTLIQIVGLFTILTPFSVAAAQSGSIVEKTASFPSLRGNLVEDFDRHLLNLYLPPSYAKATSRRYPVVYLLHGYQGTYKQWMGDGKGWNIRDVMDQLIRDGKIREMILVMPDAHNKYGGSFYTNSVTTGNWEDYLTKDLIAFVDSRYRTLASASSRGIAGHSMGGYGALKLAMKHPNRFGAVYGISSACLGRGGDVSLTSPARATTFSFKNFEDLKPSEKAYLSQAYMAAAAAWSPNPEERPFFVDLPASGQRENRQPAEEAAARWTANMPLYMVDQYRTNLMRLRGIAFDVGKRDQFTHIPPTNRAFARALKRNGIKHTFEEHDGDHNDKAPEQIEKKVLPLFSRVLEFEK